MQCEAGPINRHAPGSADWFWHEANRPENAGNKQFFVDSYNRAKEREERRELEYVLTKTRDAWHTAQQFEGLSREDALAAMLKFVEWAGRDGDDYGSLCLFCEAYLGRPHFSSCPAFTPDGHVRLIAASAPPESTDSTPATEPPAPESPVLVPSLPAEPQAGEAAVAPTPT